MQYMYHVRDNGYVCAINVNERTEVAMGSATDVCLKGRGLQRLRVAPWANPMRTRNGNDLEGESLITPYASLSACSWFAYPKPSLRFH
jgi:hypothetical protein